MALLLSACRRKRAVVVLDDWWSVDYARNACAMGALKDEPACLDPKQAVLSYENLVESAFAADPACNGLVLTHFAGPEGTKLAADATARPNGTGWQVMIDFVPGAQGKVGWGVTRIGHAEGVLVQEAGSPRELAQDVCRIARRAGGAVD
ncbi:MAG TPA: hypothetical protein VMF66_15340 [Candidatus Acidoferrum sp.]|nr:hypothetical protein [Candidatus Acidoferrum sp.]